MKTTKKIKSILGILFSVIVWLYMISFVVFQFYIFPTYLSYFIEVTEFTGEQIDALQEEIGFTLPEGAEIVKASLGSGRDAMLTTTIEGISDVDDFLNNHIKFESKGNFIQYNGITEYKGTGYYKDTLRTIKIEITASGTTVELASPQYPQPLLIEMFDPPDRR